MSFDIDLFSKRNRPLPDVFTSGPLTERFRIQVLHTIVPALDLLQKSLGKDFAYKSIFMTLCREHGLLRLHTQKSQVFLVPDGFGGGTRNVNYREQVERGLVCNENELLVLDLIQTSCALLISNQDEDGTLTADYVKDVLETVNRFFRENGLGYEIELHSGRLVAKDHELIHQEVVRPALHLLAEEEFKYANQEYLDAFEDYKNGKYEDCLTKCTAAFESVMKVICKRKGWQCVQQATSKTLVETIINNAILPPFFAEPLKLVATMRNKLGSAHGQGDEPKDVPEHFARYCMNATAANILFLYQATR